MRCHRRRQLQHRHLLASHLQGHFQGARIAVLGSLSVLSGSQLGFNSMSSTRRKRTTRPPDDPLGCAFASGSLDVVGEPVLLRDPWASPSSTATFIARPTTAPFATATATTSVQVAQELDQQPVEVPHVPPSGSQTIARRVRVWHVRRRLHDRAMQHAHDDRQHAGVSREVWREWIPIHSLRTSSPLQTWSKISWKCRR